MNDILITGGGGFLGAALARELLKRGASVCCLDTAGFDRLADLAADPRLSCVRADVRSPAEIEAAVGAAGAVLHLAAVVGVDRYLTDPQAVFDVNFGGTRAVLQACARLERPVVLASTSEVYGRLPWDLTEQAGALYGDLANSRWSYALSKAMAEQTAHALASQGLRFAITRYFNVYGPRMDKPGKGRVISKFLGHLQVGEALPLVDGGEAVRSFCYVDDAVEATLRLLQGLQDDRPEIRGKTFNVGRAEPVTMRELAHRMAVLSGHTAGTVDLPGQVVFGEGFQEIPRRVPVLEALRQATGFEAKISLDDGLRRVLRHWDLLRPPGRSAALAVPEAVPMVRPVFQPDERLVGTLVDALQTGRVTNQGPVVRRFERELATFLAADEAAACASGTAGLIAGLTALGRTGKAVLPAFTYIATLNAIVAAGLQPVFCDVDPASWTLDPWHLAEILSTHADVAVVVPVNVFGVPANLTEILRLARDAGAAVVCDDAHAMGTVDRRESDVDLRVYSLHATKVLPAVEGGVVTARDPALLAEVRRLIHHGLNVAEPLRSSPGFNFKLSELHAAIGSHGLKTLPEAIARRRTYAERLRHHLRQRCGDAWLVQAVPEGVESNFQNLGVRLRAGRAPLDPLGGRFGRGAGIEEVRERLRQHGIEARRYFWPALHSLQRFAGQARLPVTEDLTRAQLCLPLHSHMDEALLCRIESATLAVVAASLPAEGEVA